MSEYKGIKGFSIQSLSADPADPNIGQVWYNSTSGSWKVTSATTAGSWATGGNLNTARSCLAGAGTQTAALAFGGFHHLQEQQKNMMEQLGLINPGLNTARADLAGAGTQTAALAFGGYITPNTAATEEYDGTAWTTVNI
jgi:hypothetical protein